jgi:hypothetical protein
MSTRKSKLRPDALGRYRPRIGFVLGADGQKKEKRFNCGTDLKEYEWRRAKIQRLYEENCRTTGEDLWSPLALSYAEAIAKGTKTIKYATFADDAGYDDPVGEYAQMIEVNRQMFPSLDLEPEDHELYLESARKNEALIANRLKELEKEMRDLGALVGNESVPEKLVSGTLHGAWDAYAAEIKRDGAKLADGTLKQYPRLRLKRVERLKREHADIPLYSLNKSQCAAMIAFWRNRPTTSRGTKSSRDNSRHHLYELSAFFEWLDGSDLFGWQMPKGVRSLRGKVAKVSGEKKLSAVTKPSYSPAQLTTLNKHATPLERLGLLLGLNCAMGAAELGRLEIDSFQFMERHPYTDKLAFESSEADSFLRCFRPKTEVFGEWLLWPATVEMSLWAIERAENLDTKLVFVWDTGLPVYNEASANPQASFANMWYRLIKRVQKSQPDFPRLPFGSLRDTLPDVIRHRYSDDLASLCLCHGSPSKADSLLECYSNKPFGRLHTAIRELESHFSPVFDAVEDPFDKSKHYLPIEVKEQVRLMLSENRRAAEIAEFCGVSVAMVHREKQKCIHPQDTGDS